MASAYFHPLLLASFLFDLIAESEESPAISPPLSVGISVSPSVQDKGSLFLFSEIAPFESLLENSGCFLFPIACGKSTLLKILAGVVNPTSGNVFVEKPKNFVFQNPDHQVVMPTVEADVAFGLGKYHDMNQEEVKSRVIKALEAVDMRDYMQRPIQTLSGGQKQRVAIAGALAEACKVLLLDELTTFLDESDQLGVIKAVKDLINAKKGGDVTALWVTHRLEELEFADGAVYMENGRVIKHGAASAISDFIKAKQSSYIDQIGS